MQAQEEGQAGKAVGCKVLDSIQSTNGVMESTLPPGLLQHHHQPYVHLEYYCTVLDSHGVMEYTLPPGLLQHHHQPYVHLGYYCTATGSWSTLSHQGSFSTTTSRMFT